MSRAWLRALISRDRRGRDYTRSCLDSNVEGAGIVPSSCSLLWPEFQRDAYAAVVAGLEGKDRMGRVRARHDVWHTRPRDGNIRDPQAPKIEALKLQRRYML